MLTGLFEENHVHTTYSDGEATPKQYLELNKLKKRFNQITFTDHVNTKTPWFPEFVEEIRQLRTEHPEVNIRIGCEVKVLNDGNLNTTNEILDACDVVVGSVHFFEDVNNFDGMANLSREEVIQREVALLELLTQHPKVDIIGHPFGMSILFRKANIPYDMWMAFYRVCKAAGKKMEFNPSYSSEFQLAAFRDIIKMDGTEFISLGSDAHCLSEFGRANKELIPAIRVLVTESGSSVAQGLLKILIRDKEMMRYVIHTADSNPDATGNHFVGVDYKTTLPLISDPKYLPKLREYIHKNDIDVVLIGGDIELDILSKKENQDYLLTGTDCKIIVGTSEFINLSLNKENTLTWEIGNFVPSPATWNTIKDPIDDSEWNIFPCIVKPSVGWGANHILRCENKEQLTQYTKYLDAQNIRWIVQEYITGDEYTCEVVKTNGIVHGIICMERVLQKGVTKTAKTLDPEKHKKYYDFVRMVAEKLPYNGVFNIQLIDDHKEDQPMLMEINSRFSGTTGLRNLCGFDSIRMIILYERFGIPINPEYLKNFQLLNFYRYWDEVVE